jgi:SAM-dependent methyltransferase
MTVRHVRRASRFAAPRRSIAPAPLEDSLGRIPTGTRVYDRVHYLLDRARGRNVIHLGFVDARNMREKLDSSAWLHAKLAEVAASIVGIDADAAGVEVARELGYEAYVADVENAASIKTAGAAPADVVIAGEIIEHLDSPGRFLDSTSQLIKPDGELVITTPNPTALTNVVLGLMRREVQNADHVGWQSWRTLAALLSRHGYDVSELAYYRHPRFVASPQQRLGARMRCWTFNAYQSIAWPVLAAAPSLADGLIVVAKPVAAANQP